MARDAVTVTDLTLDTAVVMGAGVTINVSNGAVINAGGSTRGLFLRVTNTNGSDRVLTVKAGDNPPSLNSGKGDITATVVATTGDVLLSMEGARVLQDDGTINVDFAASFAGKIWAFRVPKGV